MTAAPSAPRSGRLAGLFGAPYRIFFLLASLEAALAVPAWLGALVHGWPLGPGGDALAWHTHEMLFGVLSAVVAGFLFTAIPNWTGRLPLAGPGLVALAALWLAGRFAMLAAPDPWPALVAPAFLVVVAGLAWREVAAGRNWRNLPPCLLVSLFAAAGIAVHVPDAAGAAVRVALATVAMLIVLIGGRIVPSFTRNWLAKEGRTTFPAPFGRLDRAAMAGSAAALVAWAITPSSLVAGALLAAAGALNGLRLSRWRGHDARREPLLLVLHLGYLWLAFSLLLLGGAALLPEVVMSSQAIHALTAGAFGTMTLAVMTRATLGHSGRALSAGPATIAIYGLVTAGALLRVAAPLFPEAYVMVLSIAGLLWSGAYGLFAIAYAPILFAARRSAPSGG